MSDSAKLKLVLCWHMHQPNYFDPVTQEYDLPWTYLHVIKDYVDMVAHLEAAPAARVVVNFAPILLEQIDDYAKQVEGYLDGGDDLSDPLLQALASADFSGGYSRRTALVKACLRVNHETVIRRFPSYQLLADMAPSLLEDVDKFLYVSDQYIVDLLVWYHLGWLGETIRRNDERVMRLMRKAREFTPDDCTLLLQIIGEQLSTVLTRYRRLAEQGQIELSFTPYAHPIMPLLLDINTTHEAMPDAPLPETTAYPGGEERVRWHIRKGLAVFEHYFGFRPQGCWPSEGAVSSEVLHILADEGLCWSASGESVLRNSLAQKETPSELQEQGCIHRPYLLADERINGFFRDDGLSDLIGFTYSGWSADDAVNDLLSHLQNIKMACAENGDAVVSIILDGENAWESYPENAYPFLTALYEKLSTHPAIEMTTFADCLKEISPRASVPKVVAGSWVYGTFSTWIGEPDKNRGWDMLIAAKQAYDRVMAGVELSADEVDELERQLAVCEGSDWFWWFGDYNSADAVSDFERLYRIQLATLYRMLGTEPPDSLSQTFSYGGGAPAASGTMRHGQESQ